MFNKITHFLRINRRKERALNSANGTPLKSDFFTPLTGSALIDMNSRRLAIQQLWKYSLLPAALHRQFYLLPLEGLLAQVQNVPAALSGPWSYSGGYGDMVIKFVSCAIRLLKGYMLPPNSSAEEQASECMIWNAVVYWAAIFYHLPLLSSFEGELQNGQRWLLGTTVPSMPYRFRFRDSPQPKLDMQSIASFQAIQLLPEGAIDWLIIYPQALQCLINGLCGHSMPIKLIDDLLLEAAKLVQTPLFSLSNSLETSDSQPLMDNSEIIIRRPLINSAFPHSELEDNKTKVEAAPESCLIEPMISDPLPNKKTHEGNAFWEWMILGLKSGDITVNLPTSRLHIGAGYLLLPVPDIFYQYLKAVAQPAEDRERVQRAFEALRNHKHESTGRFYWAKIYQSQEHKGRFKKVKGYLVKSNLVFSLTPEDSRYLAID
ncbi:conjugal transfer nickase/helicase domain-containing protein [Rouxiella silvae]|uniref:conjugal transfer nickase/helicase domain-containing protein n=1 Tax=Rouxiella silvae TaxID=1646373 RepID=UPI0039EEEE8F